MGEPPYYENKYRPFTLNGEIKFEQYTIGETDEEYIWMFRDSEELFEVERDPVQEMLGDTDLE